MGRAWDKRGSGRQSIHRRSGFGPGAEVPAEGGRESGVSGGEADLFGVEVGGQEKSPGHLATPGPFILIGRRPTLPPTRAGSTIGAAKLGVDVNSIS